jgi:hypothetical protein
MNTQSEWLDIMLGEIARKQEEAARAAAEQALRDASKATVPAGVPSDSDPEKQQGPDMIFTDVGELVAGYGNERTSGDK